MIDKNEAVISQDLSLLLDLLKARIDYILLLLLIIWDSEYLTSNFETAELLFLFSWNIILSTNFFAAVISQDLSLLRSIKRQPILNLLSFWWVSEFF